MRSSIVFGVELMFSGGNGVTSMNPVSKELWEEGIHVPTFKLVSQGKFDEEGVTKLFMDVAKYPGNSATRRLDHNLADLQGESLACRLVREGADPPAAVSANARGSRLVQQLFDEFGTRFVLYYMKEIQLVAQGTVKEFLRQKYDETGGQPLRASDFVSDPFKQACRLWLTGKMDDGTEIVLEVRINREEGTAEFDWTGTGPQSHSNVSPITGQRDEVLMAVQHASFAHPRRDHLFPAKHDQP